MTNRSTVNRMTNAPTFDVAIVSRGPLLVEAVEEGERHTSW